MHFTGISRWSAKFSPRSTYVHMYVAIPRCRMYDSLYARECSRRSMPQTLRKGFADRPQCREDGKIMADVLPHGWTEGPWRVAAPPPEGSECVGKEREQPANRIHPHPHPHPPPPSPSATRMQHANSPASPLGGGGGGLLVGWEGGEGKRWERRGGAKPGPWDMFLTPNTHLLVSRDSSGSTGCPF